MARKIGSTLLFCLGTLGLVLVGTSSGHAAKPGEGLTVCISLDKMDSPSRDGQVKLWKAEAADIGMKLILQVAGEDAQRQSAQVDTCIAQKVAGIVSIPWDTQAVLQDIDRAHEAHIPFAGIDQLPAEKDSIDFFSGADPHADGMHAAERLISLIGDKPTKVVDLQGALDQVNGQQRDQGFKDGIKSHPNIKIVSEIPTNWHPEPVLAGMENALLANPDIGAVFVASDGLLPPIWSALKKVNRYVKVGEPNHVIVLSIDGDPQGCQSVRDGYMDGGYAQPFADMTLAALQAIIELHDGKTLDEAHKVKLIPSYQYTPSDFATTKSKVWGCAQ
jgi:simple sugar transport system substrate-binding protein/ribose transport system substrate-binding protein